jgi:hypothetical protein
MVKPIVAAVASLFLAANAAAQTPSAPPAAPPPACAGAAHRAFDFWIGQWDAYVTGTETLAGRSVIEAKDAGCVITEQWTSMRSAYTGRSLNMLDQTTGKWLQFWMDSGGEITRFEGGPTATGMQLTAPDEAAPGRQGKQWARMTFTRNADGTVRQFGETSSDGGKTWVASYDFQYRPRRTQ